MASFEEVRAKYPQYEDLSDQQLAEGLHKKFYSDLPFDQFAQKIGYSSQPAATEDPLAKYKDMSLWDRVKNDASSIGKMLTPIPRGVVKGVTALPGLAADMGVSARNMLTGSDYELPTQMQERSLDQYLPLPNVPGDKTLEFLSAAGTGAKIPAPQAAQQAPAGFRSASQDAVRLGTLASSQKAGYVVPPATTNPTITNKILESVGGKIATAQDAALKNQGVTNTLAKRAVGLSEDAPLTQEGLNAVRSEAGDVYSMLRGAGKITADKQFADDLAKVSAKFSGASKDFPELAKSTVTDLVAGANKPAFSSDSAVDLLAILRDKASTAYAAGDKGLGGAYKSVAKAIEDVIQRNLQSAGKGDLVNQFKDARQLIAKTYSVEGAFNPATGNAVGTKLASQLTRGKPLSGDLLTAGRFAQGFPKAAQGVTDSGSVRNTDVILGAGTSALSGQPGWLLYPFARQATRSFLLSPMGQKLATPTEGRGIPPEILLGALSAAQQQRSLEE